MQYEEDKKLHQQILNLIGKHFRRSGKILSSIQFKFDSQMLDKGVVTVNGFKRTWKYPKESLAIKTKQ